MPFLSPNQQCQSTERKNITFIKIKKYITFQRLAHPKLTWGSSNFVFDYERLLVTLGEGCNASQQPSDVITPSMMTKKIAIGKNNLNLVIMIEKIMKIPDFLSTRMISTKTPQICITI